MTDNRLVFELRHQMKGPIVRSKSKYYLLNKKLAKHSLVSENRETEKTDEKHKNSKRLSIKNVLQIQ